MIVKKLSVSPGSLWYYVRNSTSARNLRLLSPSRCANVARSLRDYALRRSVCRSRPFVLRLEASAVCNLRCPPCNTPRRRLRKPFLSPAEHGAIIGQLGEFLIKASYFIDGEPLLNPGLPDMIKLATARKIYCSFSTNFNHIDARKLRALSESGLDYIRICLDGFSQRTYETYRVGGDVDKVKDGIRELVRLRTRSGSRTPYVSVQTIDFDRIQAELPDIEAFCRTAGVDEWTLVEDFFRPRPLQERARPVRRRRCFYPWISLSVDVNGNVYPCHVSRTIPYGNLLTDSIDTIWNNALYRATRAFLSGGPRDPGLELPCHRCTVFGAGAAATP